MGNSCTEDKIKCNGTSYTQRQTNNTDNKLNEGAKLNDGNDEESTISGGREFHKKGTHKICLTLHNNSG